MEDSASVDSEGILYISTGDEFIEESIRSVKLLRKSMPEANVTLLCDKEISNELFDRIIRIDDPAYGFEDQILNLEKSPYDRTIYLDSDTYITDNIKELFQLLDSFDIGLAQTATREAWEVSGVPDCFPEYNSGVMVYKNNDNFEEFLSLWNSIYFSNKNNNVTMRNQPSLRKALYKSNLRLATIPPEYNCRINYPGQVSGKVKIFHARLQSVDGPGADNYFDIENAAEKINKTEDPRVFTQLGGISVYTNKTDSLFHRARLSYRMHGLKHVFKEGFKSLFRIK